MNRRLTSSNAVNKQVKKIEVSKSQVQKIEVSKIFQVKKFEVSKIFQVKKLEVSKICQVKKFEVWKLFSKKLFHLHHCKLSHFGLGAVQKSADQFSGLFFTPPSLCWYYTDHRSRPLPPSPLSADWFFLNKIVLKYLYKSPYW